MNETEREKLCPGCGHTLVEDKEVCFDCYCWMQDEDGARA